jgi:Domain of unknown function (DUF4349)
MSATDRSELDGYEALVSELRATPPVAPERLRERVLGLEPGTRPRMSKRRRLVLVVVPVAVVLSVGAALVHGLVSSGSNQNRTDAAALANGKAAIPGIAERVPGKTMTKKFGALTGAYGAALGSQQLATPSPSAWNAVTIPKNRLVHADASMQVQVPSHAALTKATNEATQIVSTLGGYAQNVQYQSSRGGVGNAFLSLRVPVGKAETALGRLAALGKLVSQQVSTKDLQTQLTHQNNGIGSLQRAIAVYEQALKSGTLSASERVQIQIKLSNARHSITRLRKARTGTLASGATANISLTLTTNKNAGLFVHHHSSSRFDRLLGSAGHFLAFEGIIFLYALIVVAPLLVIGGLVWWVVRERRRREERLLASA